MMVKFKQQIHPGDVGLDVSAVKHAFKRLHVQGSEHVVQSRKAGSMFVKALRNYQHNHKIEADGIYGPETHKSLAPKFSAYENWLYRSAKVRKVVFNPWAHSGRQCAQQLLKYRQQGKYNADNPGDLNDIIATAEGKKVWSQGGYWVSIDSRVMQILCYLIEKGYRIGTFAICSDHFNDGPHGHAGGYAVDISSINGHSITTHSDAVRSLVLQIDHLLHVAHAEPRQLITGGYGYHRDSVISSLSIPAADSYYGSTTMAEHCNHIHVGY